MNPNPLPRLEGYEVFEKIGEGGMATVYRGRQTDSGQVVAVKFLSPRLAANPVLLKRFEQEFRTASHLDHPNIVRSLAFGQSDSGPHLIMEFVEGESLGDRIEREGPLPPAEAVDLVAQVARALDYAHREGVIHRDVKPDNIMLTPDGRARLTDFGLVKQLADDLDLTRPGQGLGTPNFIAPEQLLNAKATDRRCDVYGLGATLYMAVTGRLPFAARTPMLTLELKIRNSLDLPRQVVADVSEHLERVILRAMHPDCGQRPASRAEFLVELTGPGSAPPLPAVTTVPRRVRPSEPAVAPVRPGGPGGPAESAGSVGWHWIVAGAVLGTAAGVAVALFHH